MMAIYIHLCCNYPDNGAFGGRLAAFEFDVAGQGGNATWECRYGDWSPDLKLKNAVKPRDAFHKSTMRIGRRDYYLGYGRDWVGNWCWCAYQMPGVEIVRFLNEPKIRKWFACTEAEISLFEAWKEGKPFTQEMLKLL